MRQWFVRVEENEEQFADSSFKNLSIRNSGCSILRWILLERAESPQDSVRPFAVVCTVMEHFHAQKSLAVV